MTDHPESLFVVFAELDTTCHMAYPAHQTGLCGEACVEYIRKDLYAGEEGPLYTGIEPSVLASVKQVLLALARVNRDANRQGTAVTIDTCIEQLGGTQ